MNPDVPYLVALTTAPGIGPVKTQVLLDFFKSAREVWDAPESDLQAILGKHDFEHFSEYRKKFDVVTNFEGLSKQAIRVITILEDNYPKSLRQISAPPPVLYYKGDLLSTLQAPCFGVVGTRLVTAYGREVTARLVSGLVEAGLVIVSGLARGVDTVAHQAAIEAGGQTIAVLGNGLSQIYPAQNYKLAAAILDGHGALVSDYPPEMIALPQNFPARNRIISGLSIGVLVTEAAEGSGSLITASFAAEQGRDVFAVPGPITSKLSKGPSKLIRLGAKLVGGVEDILEEIKLGGVKGIGVKKEVRDYTPEGETEAKMWSLLENEAKSVDQLVRETGLTTAKVSSTLTLLEIKGVITNLGTGVYSRK